MGIQNSTHSVVDFLHIMLAAVRSLQFSLPDMALPSCLGTSVAYYGPQGINAVIHRTLLQNLTLPQCCIGAQNSAALIKQLQVWYHTLQVIR